MCPLILTFASVKLCFALKAGFIQWTVEKYLESGRILVVSFQGFKILEYFTVLFLIFRQAHTHIYILYW